jgi:hypothetical protein
MKIFYILLFSIININNIYSFTLFSNIPLPPSYIKHIEYNTAFKSLSSWTLANKRKYTNDIIWLTKSKSLYKKAVMIGIYDQTEILNYICYLEVLNEEKNNIILKLQNIFNNPKNDINDDYNLGIALKSYATENKLLINDDELKHINDGKYFLTIMYYSLFSCT